MPKKINLEFIGIKEFRHYINNEFYLKRDLLMFDRIGVFSRIDDIDNMRNYGGSSSYLILQCEWLLEKGVMFDTEEYKIGENFYDDCLHKDLINIKKLIKKIKKTKKLRGKKISKKEKDENDVNSKWDGVIKLCEEIKAEKKFEMNLIGSWITRFYTENLRQNYKLEAFPIVSTMKLPRQVAKEIEKKAEVINLVLKSIAIPSELTSWEQILEFRNDPESRGKFLALRNWMSEVARAKLTPNETEEKLEWLLHSYRQHMDLHKLKYETGILETIVYTSAELVECLIKLRFSRLAQSVFSMKHKKIDLMTEELRAPGKEVAYIIGAKEKFL